MSGYKRVMFSAIGLVLLCILALAQCTRTSKAGGELLRYNKAENLASWTEVREFNTHSGIHCVYVVGYSGRSDLRCWRDGERGE